MDVGLRGEFTDFKDIHVYDVDGFRRPEEEAFDDDSVFLFMDDTYSESLLFNEFCL